MTLNVLLLVGAISLSTCIAKVFTDPAQLGPQPVYDFVVVGAGTAGNVIANRLTEDDATSVLVIEAGVTNIGVLGSEVPFDAPTLSPNTPWTWNFTTVPQIGLNNRTIPLPRGRILGGSSSINFLVYTRGSSDDLDRFAKVTGDDGWSWNALRPYILKHETFVHSADNHNTTGQILPSAHGTKGPVHVSVAGFPTPIDPMVIETTKELTAEFPFNLDMNSGNTIGIGWSQSTIDTSVRSSSATTYLAPQILSRPNLDVLIQTQVTKVIPTSQGRGKPTFGRVEMAQTALSKRFVATARKEIILSAGSIGTPQVLMLSGIGDKQSLAKLGINSLVDIPDVGQHLQDHPLLGNSWLVNSNNTFDNIQRNATLSAELFQQWNETRTGQLVDSSTNNIGWLRLPSDSPIFKIYADPSAGERSAHFEHIFGNSGGIKPLPPTGNFMSVSANVASPMSRGSVTLNSTDPFDFPLIDTAFYTHPFDIFTAREAIKSAMRFLAAPVWKDYVIAPFGDLATADTDEKLEAYARANAQSLKHPVGTARMASYVDKNGVVGPDLLVKGVTGLRIVDASIFPYIPAAHTQAPVYIIAERAADLIKQAWKKA